MYSSGRAHSLPVRNFFHAIIGAGVLFCLGYLIFTNNAKIENEKHTWHVFGSQTGNNTIQSRVNAFNEIFHFPTGSSNKIDTAQNHAFLSTPVVIYNRIPKTGSTTVMGIAYELCTVNEAHVIHINISRNNHILSLRNQLRLIKNISQWTQVYPALFHGHFAFLDFAQLGSNLVPLYINVVRDPLERLVSYYYFLRYGDDFRPHLIRKRMKDTNLQNQTFDACVQVGGSDCDFNKLWLQVPFFCGQSPVCWNPGSRNALEIAKKNVLTKYFLVGTTKNLKEFLSVLDTALPQFFQGAMQLYTNESLGLSHRRRTRKKRPLEESTMEKVKQSSVWKVEQEFYEFAESNFMKIFQREQSSRFKNQDIFYEKIKSKKKNHYPSANMFGPVT